MLKSAVFRAVARTAFPVLVTLAVIAPLAWADEDESAEEESWYCIADPVENDWDCGLGKAPEPKTMPAEQQPGVRPREDYTPEVQPLAGPGGTAPAPGDDSLFGATPLAEPESAEPPEPEPQADEPIRASPAGPAAPPPAPVETPAPVSATSSAPGQEGDYLIQLMGGHESGSADAFIRKYGLGDQATRLRITREGAPWFLVVLGPYPDFETAKQALFALPMDLQTLDPWIRRRSELD